MKTRKVVDVDLQKRLAEKLDKVSWHGHYFSCLCIFHDNKNTPALMVYPDGYYCKSCGAGGGLGWLDAKLSGSTIRYHEYQEDIVEHPDFIRWKNKYGSYEKAAAHAYETGQQYPILMDYIRNRGLGKAIRQGNIGYLDGWYSFPVFYDGNMVDWVVRAGPNVETNIKYALRPRKNSNEGFILYSADWSKIEESNSIWIPFGILDMWALHLIGLPTATGLTGKTFKLEWFNEIRKHIHLVPDLGEEDAANKFSRLLGWRGSVCMLDYPDGCKDSADVYKNFGEVGLRNLFTGDFNYDK